MLAEGFGNIILSSYGKVLNPEKFNHLTVFASDFIIYFSSWVTSALYGH